MKLLTLALMMILSTNVLAIAGGCRGSFEGQEILINVYGEGSDPREATGTLMVDGREVSRFDGRDARINYFLQSAKVSNAQGDTVEGKVLSLIEKTGMITRLEVPGYGINMRNIPVQCWGDQ